MPKSFSRADLVRGFDRLQKLGFDLREAKSEEEERAIRRAAAMLATSKEQRAAEKEQGARRERLEWLTNPHVQEARALGFKDPSERVRTLLAMQAEKRLEAPRLTADALERDLASGKITLDEYRAARLLSKAREPITESERLGQRDEAIRGAGERAMQGYEATAPTTLLEMIPQEDEDVIARLLRSGRPGMALPPISIFGISPEETTRVRTEAERRAERLLGVRGETAVKVAKPTPEEAAEDELAGILESSGYDGAYRLTGEGRELLRIMAHGTAAQKEKELDRYKDQRGRYRPDRLRRLVTTPTE